MYNTCVLCIRLIRIYERWNIGDNGALSQAVLTELSNQQQKLLSMENTNEPPSKGHQNDFNDLIPNDILADVLGESPFNMNMAEQQLQQQQQQTEIPLILQQDQDIVQTAMMELISHEAERPSKGSRPRNDSRSDFSDEGIGLSPPMLQVDNFLFIHMYVCRDACRDGQGSGWTVGGNFGNFYSGGQSHFGGGVKQFLIIFSFLLNFGNFFCNFYNFVVPI